MPNMCPLISNMVFKLYFPVYLIFWQRHASEFWYSKVNIKNKKQQSQASFKKAFDSLSFRTFHLSTVISGAMFWILKNPNNLKCGSLIQLIFEFYETGKYVGPLSFWILSTKVANVIFTLLMLTMYIDNVQWQLPYQ